MFSIGQRVLCIKGGWGEYGMLMRPESCPNRPARGSRYIIRTVEYDPVVFIECVRLVEIVNPPTELIVDPTGNKAMAEPTFAACNFVPIEERKTDISIFTQMLNQEPVTVGMLPKSTLALLDKAIEDMIRSGPQRPERGGICSHCGMPEMYKNGSGMTCINCGYSE